MELIEQGRLNTRELNFLKAELSRFQKDNEQLQTTVSESLIELILNCCSTQITRMVFAMERERRGETDEEDGTPLFVSIQSMQKERASLESEVRTLKENAREKVSEIGNGGV